MQHNPIHTATAAMFFLINEGINTMFLMLNEKRCLSYCIVVITLLCCFCAANAIETHIYQPGTQTVHNIIDVATPRVSGQTQTNYNFSTTGYVNAKGNSTYHNYNIKAVKNNRVVHNYGSSATGQQSYTTGSKTTSSNSSMSSGYHIGQLSFGFQKKDEKTSVAVSNERFSQNVSTIGKRRATGAEFMPGFGEYENDFLEWLKKKYPGRYDDFVRNETDIDYTDYLSWLSESGLHNSSDHPDLLDKFWEYIRADEKAPLDDGLWWLLMLITIFLIKRSNYKIIV